VLDPDASEVLLIHHLASDWWQFPGGHVDADETPAEAAIREVYEETGARATILGRLGLTLPGMVAHPAPWAVYEMPAPAKPDRPGKPAEPAHSHIDELFIATASSADPLAALESEVSGARWWRIGQLRDADGVRADVYPLAVAAYKAVRGSDRREFHGIQVSGNGSVSMSAVAVGPGSTVIQAGGTVRGRLH
jgi:8-oxo-dGTP pyrophosphatase MutT (NUDIX family)